MKKVRIDKWLWSVRLFKSRTISTEACKSGKVSQGGKNLKPSYLISEGEIVELKKGGFNLLIKSQKLIEKRVSATLAQECYENLTPQEEMNKYKSWFIGKAGAERRMPGAGRPTKKERREIEGFKDDYFFLEGLDENE
jgi:ribosome-associated heat shock protein Hsp15